MYIWNFFNFGEKNNEIWIHSVWYVKDITLYFFFWFLFICISKNMYIQCIHYSTIQFSLCWVTNNRGRSVHTFFSVLVACLKAFHNSVVKWIKKCCFVWNNSQGLMRALSLFAFSICFSPLFVRVVVRFLMFILFSYSYNNHTHRSQPVCIISFYYLKFNGWNIKRG